MTLQEIKDAVAAGKTVHWMSDLYSVKKWDGDHWVIVCRHNNHAIGLTWQDGTTVNGDEDEFYIAGTEHVVPSHEERLRRVRQRMEQRD